MPSTWNGEPITAADLAKRLVRPARGSAKLARMKKKRMADDRESRNKTKVRKRDGHCRWPHATDEERELCRRERSECAHLTHKGAGGDVLTIRSKPNLMINVCKPVHQGPGSLHAGDRKVSFLTAEKADGPLVFYERRGRSAWAEVGRELWPGVLAPRKDQR